MSGSLEWFGPPAGGGARAVASGWAAAAPGRPRVRALRRALVLALMSLPAVGLRAEPRLPTIAAQEYDAEQRQAAQEFLAARKTPVFGPFEPLMYSPQVMSLARGMGDYLRYHSALGNTLSELAILVTARVWSQDYEWYVHAPIAVKAGVKPDIVAAIADGRRPLGMNDDEEIVYEFSTELHHNKRVSDRTFERAEKRFGKKGVVDLTGINAYYALLAMELNVARYPMPADGQRLVRLPE